MFVREVRCDGLECLFKACPNEKRAKFEIQDKMSIQNAVDCFTKLVDVVWSKHCLTNLRIEIRSAENKFWDSHALEQFDRDVKLAVQKMRLRTLRYASMFGNTPNVPSPTPHLLDFQRDSKHHEL